MNDLVGGDFAPPGLGKPRLRMVAVEQSGVRTAVRGSLVVERILAHVLHQHWFRQPCVGAMQRAPLSNGWPTQGSDPRRLAVCAVPPACPGIVAGLIPWLITRWQGPGVGGVWRWFAEPVGWLLHRRRCGVPGPRVRPLRREGAWDPRAAGSDEVTGGERHLTVGAQPDVPGRHGRDHRTGVSVHQLISRGLRGGGRRLRRLLRAPV